MRCDLSIFIDVDMLPRLLLKGAAGLRARRRGGRSRCCSGMQRTGRASGGGGPAAGRRRAGGAACGGSEWTRAEVLQIKGKMSEM